MGFQHFARRLLRRLSSIHSPPQANSAAIFTFHHPPHTTEGTQSSSVSCSARTLPTPAVGDGAAGVRTTFTVAHLATTCSATSATARTPGADYHTSRSNALLAVPIQSAPRSKLAPPPRLLPLTASGDSLAIAPPGSGSPTGRSAASSRSHAAIPARRDCTNHRRNSHAPSVIIFCLCSSA